MLYDTAVAQGDCSVVQVARANDNHAPAGELKQGILRLHLKVDEPPLGIKILQQIFVQGPAD